MVAALAGLQHFAGGSRIEVSGFMVAPEHLISSLALGLRQALEGLSVVTVAMGGPWQSAVGGPPPLP